ncbi:hypothetical protein RUND412_008922 [Rhizina undulata]
MSFNFLAIETIPLNVRVGFLTDSLPQVQSSIRALNDEIETVISQRGLLWSHAVALLTDIMMIKKDLDQVWEYLRLVEQDILSSSYCTHFGSWNPREVWAVVLQIIFPLVRL